MRVGAATAETHATQHAPATNLPMTCSAKQDEKREVRSHAPSLGACCMEAQLTQAHMHQSWRG